MANSRLSIVSVENSKENATNTPSRATRMRQLQAKYERLWLIDPERFNPLKNIKGRERLERTWTLLTRHISLNNQQVVDIGCGAGIFSFRLADQGCQVKAVDIAANALKLVQQKRHTNVSCQQETMPFTSLPDQGYDLVVCTEVIADVYPEDYRLFFAELSRVIRPTGYLLFSSAIDIQTDQGVQRLQELALTEFDILESVVSYHALSIRLKRLLEKPALFIRGWQDKQFYEEEMKHRQGIQKLGFWICTSFFLVWLWYAILPLTTRLLHYLNTSRSCLLRLEKICRSLWHKKGISHYLFIAKQRPLKMVDPQQIPIEKPGRKEIWN
jgi:2-polyprenyl-3-methyl-5-hydroxy-6-metoxy-1,4-benzoquinol methylase